MNISRKLLTAFILLITLTLWLSPASADSSGKTEVFVDLDGDGFHDQAVDDNHDGIPDPMGSEAEGESATPTMHATTVNPFGNLTQTQVVESKTTWKAGFGVRRLAAMGLGSSRCDFDAASGDNDDRANSGLGGGGACAGGICVPR
ncbi:MAG: hypothetical protein GY867_10430 [bacterium]|nr:hypothetical protein [bacterium]